MLVRILFVVLIVQQLAHCKAPRKMKTAAIVDRINRSPGITWQAKTYGHEQIDLEEFAQTKLGTKADRRYLEALAKREKKIKTQSVADTLPSNFTWANTSRNNCSMNYIRDQGNCGSCWAVASASVLSDRFCLISNGTFKTPLSYEKLVACVSTNSGCQGGLLYNTFRYLVANGTVTGGDFESDEGCQMYSIRPCGTYHTLPCDRRISFTPKCRANKCNNDWYKYTVETKTYKMNESRWISSYYSDYAARKEIYDNGPILALFWVYPDFLLYEKGIYTHKVGVYDLGGHAIRIVGWGVENNTNYWHVANSWGRQWGENGYFRIRRGTRECGIEYYMQALMPNVTDIF